MQNLSNTAWAFSTRRVCHGPLLQAIASAAISRIPASARRRCEGACEEVAAGRAQRADLENDLLANVPRCYPGAEECGDDPQHLSISAWAFAALELQHWPLLTAIAAAARPTISAFGPQSCSNTAWALASRSFVHRPGLEALAEAALRNSAQFAMQNLSNTAWAFATRRLYHGPLRAAISSQAIPKIRGGTALLSVHPEYAQSFANTSWAFSALQVRHEPLLDAISSEALKTLAVSAEGSLVCCLEGLGLPWALWRGLRMEVPWRMADHFGFGLGRKGDELECF
mmetsp:Transcript_81659/g.189659  ORF Transcript_81659/g.189659 Transcript_81659/m.189659 type:complete len:284 (-) Transcript_81659:72-923(-)